MRFPFWIFTEYSGKEFSTTKWEKVLYSLLAAFVIVQLTIKGVFDDLAAFATLMGFLFGVGTVNAVKSYRQKQIGNGKQDAADSIP